MATSPGQEPTGEQPTNLETTTAAAVTPDEVGEGQKEPSDRSHNDPPTQELEEESTKPSDEGIDQQTEKGSAEDNELAMASQVIEYERGESELGFGETYEVSYREEDDSEEDDSTDEDLCSSSEEGAIGPTGFGRARSWQDSIVSTASFTLSLGSCDEVSSLEADFGDDEEIEEEEYSIDDISVSDDEREVVDFHKSIAEIELRKMFSKASFSFDPDASEIEEITEVEEVGDFPADSLASPAAGGGSQSSLSDAKAYLVAMAAVVSPSGRKGSPIRQSRRMSEVSAVSEYSEYEIEEGEEFEEDFDEEEYIDDIEEEFVEEEVTEVDYAEEDDLDGNPVQVSAS